MQLILSAVLVLSMPKPETRPQGALAVLLLVVSFFRNGRGVLLFVMFGWARAHYEVMLLLQKLFPPSSKKRDSTSDKECKKYTEDSFESAAERAAAVWAFGV